MALPKNRCENVGAPFSRKSSRTIELGATFFFSDKPRGLNQKTAGLFGTGWLIANFDISSGPDSIKGIKRGQNSLPPVGVSNGHSKL